MIGNILLEATALIPGQSVLGFENHGGRTYLGAGARPFAKVIRGFGNNDTDHPRNEGCVEGNILGTYLHGSLLPKNPALTDWFIATAMTQKMPQFKLKPVVSAWEERAFDQAKSRL